MDDLKDRNRDLQYKNIIAALESDSRAPAPVTMLKASRMRSIVNSYYFREAYKKTTHVAFTGELCPTELLLAFKMVSLNLETMAALFSQSDRLRVYLKQADEYGVSRDICSNIRSGLGIALANCCPAPDVVLGNSYPCDGISKMTFVMSRLYHCPYFMLDTPNYVSDEAVVYLVEQMKRFISEVEKILHVTFSYEDLRRVVDYSNKAREYFNKVNQLCETATLRDVPRELIEIVVSNLWGSKELVDICRTLYDEALAKTNNGENRKTKTRVLWVGQLPFYSDELVDYLVNDCELELIYLSALMNSEFMLDRDKPLESIARRLLIHTWDPMAIRNDITQIARKFGIDGIVLLNVWGCRNMMGINHMLRDAAVQNDLTFLTVDGDYLDKEKYSFSHLKNRVDAFVEIIK